MTVLYILIIVVAALLSLVVLAQNPKGGGLAQGFTGASQIGGVQRTADFLEKSTWTLAAALMCCACSAVPHAPRPARIPWMRRARRPLLQPPLLKPRSHPIAV